MCGCWPGSRAGDGAGCGHLAGWSIRGRWRRTETPFSGCSGCGGAGGGRMGEIPPAPGGWWSLKYSKLVKKCKGSASRKFPPQRNPRKMGSDTQCTFFLAPVLPTFPQHIGGSPPRKPSVVPNSRLRMPLHGADPLAPAPSVKFDIPFGINSLRPIARDANRFAAGTGRRNRKRCIGCLTPFPG